MQHVSNGGRTPSIAFVQYNGLSMDIVHVSKTNTGNGITSNVDGNSITINGFASDKLVTVVQFGRHEIIGTFTIS